MLYCFADDFVSFLLAELAFAVWIALMSGADTAMIYDSLKQQHREYDFSKVWGSIFFYCTLALSMANAAAGFIGQYDLRWTFYFSLPFPMISLVAAYYLLEPDSKQNQQTLKQHINTIKQAFNHDRVLIPLMLYAALVFVFNQSGLWIYQPYFKIAGIELIYFGFIFGSFQFVAALATQAKYMIFLARTSQGGKNKYAGLSFFLSPMLIEGVEAQPIKKLTGEYGFCQTFFTDARISSSCLIGNEGEGWQVAMATLMFERGAAGGQAGGLSFMEVGINDVVELARRAKRNGKPAIEDPMIRDELVQMIIESQGNSCAHSKDRIPALSSERPTSVSMSGKLRGTELKRRMTKLAISLQGANGGRFISKDAIDGGRWQRSYFNSFSATIGGGTSQIQGNIIGERVLGLAKS